MLNYFYGVIFGTLLKPLLTNPIKRDWWFIRGTIYRRALPISAELVSGLQQCSNIPIRTRIFLLAKKMRRVLSTPLTFIPFGLIIPVIVQEILEGKKNLFILYRPYSYTLWSIVETFHLEYEKFSGVLSLWISPTVCVAFFFFKLNLSQLNDGRYPNWQNIKNNCSIYVFIMLIKIMSMNCNALN